MNKKRTVLISPILIFFLLIFLNSIYSQSAVIHYSYDGNGNRIQRWVEILKISKTDSIDSVHQDSLVKNGISNMELTSKSISIFPNPTKGLLDLKITGMKEGEIAEYVFVSLKGQELLRKKTGLPVTRIDIGNFAPGTYILNVTLSGKKEQWKVVKQ